jgi:lysophospholipase L1-like esterase
VQVTPGRPVRVVCVGDSNTRGQAAVDYVELLRRRFRSRPFEFVNRGVNFDLAANVLARLDRVIADEPDVVTVLIGTNDANATLSDENRRVITMVKRPARLTIDGYREDLTGIVQRLKQHTRARIGLLSLPALGEEPDSPANRRAAEYSAVVEGVAAAAGAAYLPLHERQIAHLRSLPGPPGTAYRSGYFLASTASLQHFLLRRSLDAIAARRGLSLTTDTLHQNSRGAGMIADLIEEFADRMTGEVPPGEEFSNAD